MVVRPAILTIIIGMALVTYLPRMLPLVVLSRFKFPPVLLQWLGFVPVAVLTALLAQSVLVTGRGELALPPERLEVLAAVPAFIVAAFTRSLMGTVVTGIAAIALLRVVF